MCARCHCFLLGKASHRVRVWLQRYDWSERDLWMAMLSLPLQQKCSSPKLSPRRESEDDRRRVQCSDIFHSFSGLESIKGMLGSIGFIR